MKMILQWIIDELDCELLVVFCHLAVWLCGLYCCFGFFKNLFLHLSLSGPISVL